MGTPSAAVPSLQRCLNDGHEVVAVWSQPDRPAGRGNKLKQPEVKEFALANNLTVEQPTRIKTDEAKELFRSYEADAAIVVAYGRILPAEFLAAPRRGCINVHFSLLPKYRGAAPVNWAIVNGEEKTGVTTMFVEQELDSGPILLQRETTIGPNETTPDLMARLSEMGADLLGDTLNRLDELTPRLQRHSDASLAPVLTRADGLIDWTRDAVLIERAVRGFQPWPNAFTMIKSARLVVLEAQPVKDVSSQAPGTVMVARGDDLIVKAGGESALRLLSVQPEAKRRMSVRDFLNGTNLQIGDQFGEV